MDERDFRRTFDEGEESAMSQASDMPTFQSATMMRVLDDVNEKVFYMLLPS
jgi:hypothetical protein